MDTIDDGGVEGEAKHAYQISPSHYVYPCDEKEK